MARPSPLAAAVERHRVPGPLRRLTVVLGSPSHGTTTSKVSLGCKFANRWFCECGWAVTPAHLRRVMHTQQDSVRRPISLKILISTAHVANTPTPVRRLAWDACN
jgi:hypothetical protein